MNFTRTDTSVIARWWWTVDRWSIAAIAALIAIGAMMTLAASPAIATRIGTDNFHFVRRHFAFLPLAVCTIFFISLLSPRNIRRLGLVLFGGTLVALALLPLIGNHLNGATRWFSLFGISVQPSEFAKPAFAIVIAWMLYEKRLRHGFPGSLIATGIYALTAALLLIQPDVGMTLVVTAMWITQLFVAGLSWFLVILFLSLGLAAAVGAYFMFPHVAARIDRFLDSSSNLADNFQPMTAMRAFQSGGLFGRGPGEGQVKSTLPDAHTDFIMAVAGEEFGMILCLFILLLFAFLVLRGYARMLHENNLFVLLATTGLLAQFGLQAIINMASTLHMMPTKGMTLPFISYGGSSMIALSICIGMVLALTRRRVGTGELE